MTPSAPVAACAAREQGSGLFICQSSSAVLSAASGSTIIASQRAVVHSLSLFSTGGVQVGTRGTGSASAVSSGATKGTGQESVGASALDSQCLAHDGAATSSCLQVGHVGLSGIGAGAERTQCGGRSLVQERAHATRLTEKSLHIDSIRLLFFFVWLLEGRGREVWRREGRERASGGCKSK